MTRRFNAAHRDVCRRLGLGLRRLPALLQMATAAVSTGLIAMILFMLVRGASGEITESKVARARAVVMDMPLPASVRAVAQEIAVGQHNLTFQSSTSFLARNDTVELATSLGIPVFINLLGSKMDESKPTGAYELSKARAPRLSLLDTGAAIDTSDGTLERAGGYAVAGTRGANTIAVSTANGTVVPPECIDNRIPCRRRNGTVGTIVRKRALIMQDCPHTLISVGTLAATDGIGFWIGPYATESYLRPSNDPAEDIPFINVGVAILPDVDTPCMPTIARGQRGAAKFDADTVHRTFNGRSADVLRHLPECTPDAPSIWNEMFKEVGGHACDECERAKAKRVHLTGSAGLQSDADSTVAIDDWEVSVGHIHGGQRVVGGYHHNGSGVNRYYLKKTKSGAETAKCTNLYLTWMRNVSRWAITHLHGDNAPSLIAGENKTMCDSWGVHVTSCAPYEPRGNSTIERPWRTFAEDIRSALAHANLSNCESLWWYAGRDANQKDWCVPRRCAKGKEINGRKWTTKWEVLTGHRPRVTQHYPFGCLCYMLTYHPKTKVAQRGVRCLNFGRAETQPGYLCFDGSRLHVTPHCSMVPGCFPGLTRKAGGGLMVPEPKLGVGHSEVTSEEQSTEQPQRDTDTPTDGSTGGGVGDGSDGDQAAPPADNGDSDGSDDEMGDDGDDDGDGGGPPGGGPPGGGRPQHISQRLGRANRGVRTSAQFVPGVQVNMTESAEACRRFNMSADLTSESSGDFIIYIGSGRDRPGSVREHAAARNLTVVMVDKKVGGYEHDLAYAPVASALTHLVDLPNCVGVFASIPCGTWSAIRYHRPGPPVLRRLASAANGWVDETLGIKRADGSLPDAVATANLVAENMATVARAALERGKLFAYESPVSRAADSQFALKGREDHAEMSTYPALKTLIDEFRLVRTTFDQCMLGSGFEKKTQIIADQHTAERFRNKFGTRICDGKHMHKSMVSDVNETGTFVSEDAEAYPSEMNELIAEVFVETAAVRSKRPKLAKAAKAACPMTDWAGYLVQTPLMAAEEEASDAAFESAYAPDPYLHAKNACMAAPNAWRETMQWSGIDGQAFPLQAEEFAGDNPSYNQTLHGSGCTRVDRVEARRNGQPTQPRRVPRDRGRHPTLVGRAARRGLGGGQHTVGARQEARRKQRSTQAQVALRLRWSRPETAGGASGQGALLVRAVRAPIDAQVPDRQGGPRQAPASHVRRHRRLLEGQVSRR